MNTTGNWTRQANGIALNDFFASDSGTQEEFESTFTQPTLRQGSRGSAVTDLQSKLTALGFNPGPIDGIFGGGTASAVRAFQASRGLSADGVVNSSTWAALNTSQGTKPPASPWGPTPQQPSGGTLAARIVAEARKHLGYHEGPNNDNKFSSYFNVPNVPWCAYFVSYVHTMAGVPLNFGNCDTLMEYLIGRNRFDMDKPGPGRIVIFDLSGSHSDSEHVGIVESVANGVVTTIEGNSSDGVNRRTYPIGDYRIIGYGNLT